TLDCLSNGRFILGTGVGWLREEMDLLGAPTSEQRGALTDEHLRIYKELWSKEYPSFEGKWFRFSGFKFEPRPVQQPLPIWVGGSSDAALLRAARLGTGWHSPPQTPEKIAAGIKKLKQYCQLEKRPFQELTLSCSSGIVFDMDAKGKGEPQVFGLDKGPAPLYQGNPDQIATVFRRYQEAGIVHIGGNQRVKGGPPGLANSLKAIEIMAKDVMPQFK
ncbi:MAG: LLM class flavin-dependent oxidoreductase, partial [Chloroflexi bacterium]|nr:LLM class flavin-dependent oxidoreductase [Chloroflexota bacterium]